MTTETEDYDAIVAGSGVAGLSIALAAAEWGLRAVVLEKDEQIGGTTALANSLWVGNNHLARDAGHADSEDDVVRYMTFVGGDQVNEENLHTYAAEAPRALKFFEDCGVRFRLNTTLIDHYYPHAPGSMAQGRSVEADLISELELGELAGTVREKADESTYVTTDEKASWGGHQNLKAWDQDLLRTRQADRIRGRGAALIIHLAKQCQLHGVPIVRGEGVERLLHNDGRVTGVVTTTGRELHARKGVALATGGYEANPQLMNRFEDLPGPRSMFAPSSTGDGLVLGSGAGGAIDAIHNNLAVLLGFEMPGSGTTGPEFRLAGILELLSPHTLVVNYAGRRFADETYFQSVAARLRDFDVPSHRHANWPCYLIFDTQYAQKFSFAGVQPGDEIPDWVARADTPQELAAKLGIDADNVAQTVKDFNEYAASGVDLEFGRPTYDWSVSKRESWGTYTNPSLGSIEAPPFYGVQLYTAPFASAGLSINMNAQVVGFDGHPVAGLYAAGNAAAHTEYGVGYQAGYSLTSGLTFGYLAAQHMARADD